MPANDGVTETLLIDNPTGFASPPQPSLMSEQTLRRRLHLHGLLASIDVGRQTLLVRRTLEGCSRHVLHLEACNLVGTITETGPNLTL